MAHVCACACLRPRQSLACVWSHLRVRVFFFTLSLAHVCIFKGIIMKSSGFGSPSLCCAVNVFLHLCIQQFPTATTLILSTKQRVCLRVCSLHFPLVSTQNQLSVAATLLRCHSPTKPPSLAFSRQSVLLFFHCYICFFFLSFPTVFLNCPPAAQAKKEISPPLFINFQFTQLPKLQDAMAVNSPTSGPAQNKFQVLFATW